MSAPVLSDNHQELMKLKMPFKIWLMMTYFLFKLPCVRRTGVRFRYVSEDWRKALIELPLNRHTRNIHGTLYGGSIYSAVDPIYMFMLTQNLNRKFIVWDKSAEVQFMKPGNQTLLAQFIISQNEIDEINEILQHQPSVDRSYTIDWKDKDGKTYARVNKIIHVKRKDSKSLSK